MLVSSGRSKPPDTADAEPQRPAYIYPPRGPHAPAVLPPMPSMPEATPLLPPAGLPRAAMRKILMVWDSLNTLGVAYKVRRWGAAREFHTHVEEILLVHLMRGPCGLTFPIARVDSCGRSVCRWHAWRAPSVAAALSITR